MFTKIFFRKIPQICILNFVADVNECEEIENLCGANSTCQNTDGGYTCGCQTGYEKIDGSCLGEITFLVKLFIGPT